MEIRCHSPVPVRIDISLPIHSPSTNVTRHWPNSPFALNRSVKTIEDRGATSAGPCRIPLGGSPGPTIQSASPVVEHSVSSPHLQGAPENTCWRESLSQERTALIRHIALEISSRSDPTNRITRPQIHPTRRALPPVWLLAFSAAACSRSAAMPCGHSTPLRASRSLREAEIVRSCASPVSMPRAASPTYRSR